jgi:hypothetical protein
MNILSEKKLVEIGRALARPPGTPPHPHKESIEGVFNRTGCRTAFLAHENRFEITLHAQIADMALFFNDVAFMRVCK